MPLSLQALFWGLVAGLALVIGAAIGYLFSLPQRFVAGIMAFGSGVLISALSLEMMERAFRRGGFDSTAIGFICGLAIAVGSLLDGIPESIVIGPSMISGGAASVVAVAAVSLSNIPEGLSSASGMKKAGRSKAYVFGVWTGIAVLCGAASWAGYAIFSGFSDEVIAATTAVAAGAILAMLADTMIPEAYESAHDYSGLITVLGFLAAFVIGKLS